MDRMDIGIDRARLQFQVRSTSFCNVAHTAYNDIPAAVWCMEGCAQCLMTVIAAIRNLDDGAVELIVESVRGEIKGSGWSVEGNHDFISVGQSRHNCNFHSLDFAILDHICPVSHVSGDFPF